jgi:5-methyltetrahydropteroyltriglutamate--homocysteine methyltransferase
MNRSTDRILTTHVGSLIRTREIIEGMKARTLRKPYDADALDVTIRDGIREVVRKQVEIGIDIPNDGEFARRGFTAYIHERLGGIQPRPLETGERNPLDQVGHQLERAAFREFYEQHDRLDRFMWMLPGVAMDEMVDVRGKSEVFRVTGDITYTGSALVARDIDNLRSALDGLEVTDAFITAVTPTTERKDRDVLQHYRNHREYLYALADALHEEYQAITDAGFILQLDRAAQNPVLNLAGDDVIAEMELGVEVVNHALRGIPEERVRSHWCSGSGNRPHTQDIPLSKIAPTMLKLKAQAYGFEAANPRHEHEFQVWEDLKLPDGKILMPGLISQSTNIVEHPDLVAWRIKNFTRLVGKENVIAGADCGFSQDWDFVRVHPSIQWAKLQSLVDGAALASMELWSHRAVGQLQAIVGSRGALGLDRRKN